MPLGSRRRPTHALLLRSANRTAESLVLILHPLVKAHPSLAHLPHLGLGAVILVVHRAHHLPVVLAYQGPVVPTQAAIEGGRRLLLDSRGVHVLDHALPGVARMAQVALVALLALLVATLRHNTRTTNALILKIFDIFDLNNLIHGTSIYLTIVKAASKAAFTTCLRNSHKLLVVEHRIGIIP